MLQEGWGGGGDRANSSHKIGASHKDWGSLYITETVHQIAPALPRFLLHIKKCTIPYWNKTNRTRVLLWSNFRMLSSALQKMSLGSGLLQSPNISGLQSLKLVRFWAPNAEIHGSGAQGNPPSRPCIPRFVYYALFTCGWIHCTCSSLWVTEIKLIFTSFKVQTTLLHSLRS